MGFDAGQKAIVVKELGGEERLPHNFIEFRLKRPQIMVDVKMVELTGKSKGLGLPGKWGGNGAITFGELS